MLNTLTSLLYMKLKTLSIPPKMTMFQKTCVQQAIDHIKVYKLYLEHFSLRQIFNETDGKAIPGS